MALLGGGGILALIAGFLFMRRRRAMTDASELDLNSTLTPNTTTGLTTNSVFRDTGGQSVDTSSQAPVQTDFSQAGPGSIDTDEVDPVAEADVYMAYGRDAQAEEILLEARQKDPTRAAIAVKLLEIYSGRKDTKQFDALATELYGQTGGEGPHWERAAAMGRVLDPNNPIFRGTISAPSVVSVESTRDVTPAPTPAAAAVGAAIGLGAAEAVIASDGAVQGVNKVSPESLDFDLGDIGGSASAPIAASSGSSTSADLAPPQASPVKEIVPQVSAEAETPADLPDLDFDIGTKITSPGMGGGDQAAAGLELADLDFDLGVDNEMSADVAVQADQVDQAETQVWDQPAG